MKMETGDNKAFEQNWIIQAGEKSLFFQQETPEQDGCVAHNPSVSLKIVTYRYQRIVDCLIN